MEKWVATTSTNAFAQLILAAICHTVSILKGVTHAVLVPPDTKGMARVVQMLMNATARVLAVALQIARI